MTENTIQEDEINLLDYWRVLVKYKWLITFIVGGAFVTSVIVSLRLPKMYASTTSIFPPQQEESSIIARLPKGIGSLAGGFLGTNLWIGILKSQTIMDTIVKRFNLTNTFEVETLEDARNVLKGMANFDKSREGIISITVESKNPKMSADLANAFVEELDQLNRKLVMTSGRRMRVSVEKRLHESKMKLEKAEEAVKTFQEENRAVKLDAQSSAIIGAISTIKGQIMAKEVELQTLLSYATTNNPQAEILKTQMTELKKGLNELKEGKKKNSNTHQEDIFIPTARIPDISLRYARLLRDAKVQETLYGLLTQQYEMARIQEAKDSPTVQVLDIAKVPGKRSKPNRRRIVILYTVVALFLAIFLAFFLEYIEKMRGINNALPYDGKLRAQLVCSPYKIKT